MDLRSLANDNLQHALNEVYSVTSAESPLLHPFDLTHHSDYIGEPLIPTLPCLSREWREKHNAYIETGYSLERLLEARRSSWHSYLSHNDEDFKCLMMDIFVDDYNQRLLDIRKIEQSKKQLKGEEQAKKVYPTANCYSFEQVQRSQQHVYEQVQDMSTSPLLANFGVVYRCEDIEASLIATVNNNIPNMNNFVNQKQQQHQQQPSKKNKRRRRRRYRHESPMNVQQQTEALQPFDNQHHFAHVDQPQASSPMFPCSDYQTDLKAWIEYLQRPPFYFDRSPFYGEVNDYNQCLRYFQQIFPYLQYEYVNVLT